MIIIGAGMAGLLAGALDRRAVVFEAQPELPNNHHAVLRFREDKIARALDISFRRVRVLKGVAESRGPIQDSNAYALKVTGRISARSILNLEPVERWIAPPDFIAQMAELVGARLHLGRQADGSAFRAFKADKLPILSTIPMNAMLRMMGVEHGHHEFKFSGVTVLKFRVPSCDAFQTVYFPYDNAFYRATLTGDELLLESMRERVSLAEDYDSIERVLKEFAIPLEPRFLTPLATERQTLGKIVPLPDARRKALLLALTVEHGIFSLGRYACWRALLLDDVLEDYYKVKKLMALDSKYDFRQHIS